MRKLQRQCGRLTVVLLTVLMWSTEWALAAPPAGAPVPIIFDTDMGNDIDDALALAVIHALQSRGECTLLAVTLTKDNADAAPFCDLINTFYGRGNIPIGVVRGGKTPEDSNYLRGLVNARERSGANQPPGWQYPRDLDTGKDAPDATQVLRAALAGQPDGSVVVVQVGFSTNLARLLDSPADAVSPLKGEDLVARKCRLLSAMAGNFAPKEREKEYNVYIDVPSAHQLVSRWPSPIVFSGFEIGRAIKYPAVSIERDFSYVKHHPVADAYRLYMKFPYDRETWDLTSVLYAVRPDRGYFTLSPPGRVIVTAQALTTFVPTPEGRHQYLKVDAEQIAKVREALVQLASQPPRIGKP